MPNPTPAYAPTTSARSTLVVEQRPDPQTAALLRKKAHMPPDQPLMFMVFKTTFEGRETYTALCGGAVTPEGIVVLSDVGQGALSVLRNIPVDAGKRDDIAIVHVTCDPEDVPGFVERTLRNQHARFIAFVGDLTKKYDGVLSRALGIYPAEPPAPTEPRHAGSVR